MKAIDEMHQTLVRYAKLEPIVISYNQSVSVTDLASIQTTTANGSTDFVKGNCRIFLFCLFNRIN